MQPFFTSILTTTFGGQFAPKKGGQFDRIFQVGRSPPFFVCIFLCRLVLLVCRQETGMVEVV